MDEDLVIVRSIALLAAAIFSLGRPETTPDDVVAIAGQFSDFVMEEPEG